MQINSTDTANIGDLAYTLGSLVNHRQARNEGVLRTIAGALQKYVRSDMVYVAAHEGALAEAATDCAAIGPWDTDQTPRFRDLARWAGDDAAVMPQLQKNEPSVLHRRADLIDEDIFRASKLYKEFYTPMSIGDVHNAYHTSKNGSTVIVAFGAVSTDEPLDAAVLWRAKRALPLVFRAFDECWKPVPEWACGLRPQAALILQLVIDGHDDEHIAGRTGLTYHSVRAHLKRLFRVAQVRSRLHLMQAYLYGKTSEDLDREIEVINRERQAASNDSPAALSLN